MRKKLLILLSVLGLLASGGFFYWRFFRPPPPLEQKFVIEPVLEKSLTPTGVFKTNLAQPGNKALLPATKIAHQTFNNCGPATLSMTLSFFGINKTQKELGDELRPYQHPKGNNDDKVLTPEEFVDKVKEFGLMAIHRPNGTLEKLKLFLANGIPVVVKTLFKPTEDSAHFRFVRGFDEEKGQIIIDDSYFGPGRKISYFDFMSFWQPFNYGYIPVFRPEKEAIVQEILDGETDEKIAYQKALIRAEKETQLDSKNIAPRFNQVTALYHLGEFENSILEFEKIEAQLSRRVLWYQFEPILAYFELNNFPRVFEISKNLFNNGNRAFSELYLIRGKIYLKQGQEENARKEFELALKYNQNYKVAREASENLIPED